MHERHRATSTSPVNVNERKEIARLLLDSGTEAIDLELEPVIDQEAGCWRPCRSRSRTGSPLSRSRSTRRPTRRRRCRRRTWWSSPGRWPSSTPWPTCSRPGSTRAPAGTATRTDFEDKYLPQIRDGRAGAQAQRLASWFPTKIGAKTRALHQVRAAPEPGRRSRTGDGTATLPVKDLFHQIIDEVQPEARPHGRAPRGGVSTTHDLGDVVVTRGGEVPARRRVHERGVQRQDLHERLGHPDRRASATPTQLMAHVHASSSTEPEFGPPTKRYTLRRARCSSRDRRTTPRHQARDGTRHARSSTRS